MKIENVETHLVRLPYDSGAIENWVGSEWTTLDHVLIRIDTDAGITGWGDAFGYGAAEATRAAVEKIVGPSLIGRDARDIRGIHHALQVENHIWGRYGVMMFAISGVDIALWDIAGKAAGLPLYRLLGGAEARDLPAYASLFRYGDPETVARRTSDALAEGYGHVKLHEITVPAVAAAREAAGEGVPIMIDTNCPWTPDEALEMARAFAPYDPYWLEEPIFPPEDFESLAALQEAGGIPLAAGENACTAFEFQRMLAAGAVRFVQPSVTKVGGITEFLKVASLVETAGASLMPHAPYFGPGQLATLHLLTALPNSGLCEFFYWQSMEATPFGEPQKPVGGMMRAPDAPGLGRDPDPAVLRDYGA